MQIKIVVVNTNATTLTTWNSSSLSYIHHLVCERECTINYIIGLWHRNTEKKMYLDYLQIKNNVINHNVTALII